MKKTILLLTFPLLTNFAFAQNKQEAEKMVDEGLTYHDKGDYEAAISIYDKALALDKDNLLAMTEKAFSLLFLNKFDEAILLCNKSIELYPNNEGLKTIYVTYGNAFDGLKKTEKSIEKYDEGIKLFPEYYQLYFNKGVALSSLKKYNESLLCFQKSVSLNPNHASSHHAIAVLLYASDEKIPSIMAFCRFLILEPQSDRAKGSLELLQKITKANVSEKGNNTTVISLKPDKLDKIDNNGQVVENNFRSIELILSMASALDYDEKNSKKTDAEQFFRKFEAVCSSLKKRKQNNFGFYWDYYVPYFVEMDEKKLLPTFTYIAFTSSEKEDVSNWLQSHKTQIAKFNEWSENYNWDKK